MELTTEDLLYAGATHYRDQLTEKLGNDPRKALIELTQAHRILKQQEATAHLPEEVQ
jgi:hypothetical protein